MKVSISAPRRAALFGLASLAVAGCDRANSPGGAASAAAPDGAYTVPRTPWGDPDLQGKWPSTHMVGVPVQRDEKLGSRNVLNDEEYAEREARAARQTEQDNADFDIDIGGYLTPIEFDRVVVTGAVTLNGAVNVQFVNGFHAIPGDRFIVMTYPSHTGTFTTINAPPGFHVEVLNNRVEVVFGCSADFNQDGIVNSKDYFDFITLFFTSNPEDLRADFNRDGRQNSQDYFDFLTAFFSPCVL